IMYKFLVSRWVDPLIGVGIGVCAYYLHETRSHTPEGKRIKDIIYRRFISSKNE
ncbi:hypothetical protein CANTEDRAFT_106160, partial [Yamadazyma tenuis ATCC 10573]